MGQGRFRLGWILIGIAFFFALLGFIGRWRYENALRGVQMTVDYEDTRSMADAYQIPQQKLLAELKARGVSSVGIYEQSINALRDSGRLTLSTREEAARLFPEAGIEKLPPIYRAFISAPPQSQAFLQFLLSRLKEQSQPATPPRVLNGGSAGTILGVPSSRQLLGDALMGFDPIQVQTLRAAGLVPTARVSNSLNLNQKRALQLLDDAQKTGARVLIFSEDEVLGYDTLSDLVGEEMKRRGLIFGNIEFSKQRGWPDFAKQSDGLNVRVHSIGIDEAAKVKSELLVDRYARAIRERNVRVVYIRLIRQFKGQPKENISALQQNLDFVQGIHDEVHLQRLPSFLAFLRPELETAPAQAFGPYPYALSTQEARDNPSQVRRAQVLQAVMRFLYGLGAVGGVLLFLNLFFDLTARAHLRWLYAGLILLALVTLVPGFLDKGQGIGAKLLALLVGVQFAAIGILWGGLPKLWDAYGQKAAPDAPRPKLGELFVQSLGLLLKTTAITWMGGVLIVAILNDWKFLSHTDEFLGEKATLLAPLLLVGLAFSGSVFPHRVRREGATAARERAKERFFGIMGEAFTVKIAVTLGALAVAGMLFIARSGNDSGMEISDFEWYSRALLERVFITRPRTKEMFIGMPAVIFALWFTYRRQWVPALLAMIAITIGQADVVNTFCHFWTPLFYSTLRTIHAIWIGALVGLVALAIYIFLESRLLPLFASWRTEKKAAPPATESP